MASLPDCRINHLGDNHQVKYPSAERQTRHGLRTRALLSLGAFEVHFIKECNQKKIFSSSQV